ncbi:hypothetical protein HJFPF1_03445 [Paramyrothecium foliicola]|nr:hypothetical protein HJFPF1_03445 [Paramyrothecium foliicola]
MKANGESPVTGQMTVPTPLLRRIRDQDGSPRLASEDSQGPKLTEVMPSLPTRLTEQLMALKTSVSGPQYRIYEAIFHWLANILRLTKSKSDEPNRNSLLALCLRKIPACVANIEAWERQSSRENGTGFTWTSSSASADIYDQLEAFGSKKSGWRPLKIALLSHAVHLLAEAIEHEILELPFACLLGKLCAHLGRPKEASKLLLSASKGIPSISENKNDESNRESHAQTFRATIEGMSKTPESVNLFGCLNRVLWEGRLPLSWLLSQSFKDTWLRALEVVTTGKGSLSALDFLCSSMMLLSKPSNARLCASEGKKDQMFISVASAVVAAALTIGTRNKPRGDSEIPRGQRQLLFLLDKCVSQARSPSRRRASDGEGVFVLILARHLALAEESNPKLNELKREAVKELRTGLAKNGAQAQAQYDQAVRLACSVAQCRRRTRVVAGHDAVAEVCSMLEGLSSYGWSGHALRSDVAFLLAQKSRDLRDLAHAEKLAAVTNAPGANTVFSGWQWDEGMSEWVQSGPDDGGARSGTAGESLAVEQPAAPPTTLPTLRTLRPQDCEVRDEGAGRAKDRRGGRRVQKPLRSCHQPVSDTRTRDAGQPRENSSRQHDDEIVGCITSIRDGPHKSFSSKNDKRASRLNVNIMETTGSRVNKPPASVALSDGKENILGSTGRRSISDKATARVKAMGGRKWKQSNWTSARATLAPLSQGLAVDTDWDELR